jgi:hypothetical protein
LVQNIILVIAFEMGERIAEKQRRGDKVVGCSHSDNKKVDLNINDSIYKSTRPILLER